MAKDAVLVTGCAGFIGYHVASALMARGDRVIGFDSFSPYYDVRLKRVRAELLARTRPDFRLIEADLQDKAALTGLFAGGELRSVVHLAAQAGVRHSIAHPDIYAESNLVGFLNLLESCRRHPVEHLVFASSSSVYGANTRLPFSVHDRVDHPISLYAATKKAGELMAHSYSHLFGIPTTGLRFFTVYGPWGRPDMAIFLFTRAILAGDSVELFNYGKMRRDFTYIDDIAEGVLRVLDRPAQPNPAWTGAEPDSASSRAPFRLYNIGNHEPIELSRLIAAIESAVGRKALVKHAPMQAGDVEATYADITELERDVGFRPHTPIEEGVRRFVAWYRDYYRV